MSKIQTARLALRKTADCFSHFGYAPAPNIFSRRFATGKFGAYDFNSQEKAARMAFEAAQVNSRNINEPREELLGLTALNFALLISAFNTAEVLVGQGADPNVVSPTENCNADAAGYAPLHTLSISSIIPTLNTVVDDEGNVVERRRVLYPQKLLQQRRAQMAAFLIDRGADPDQRAQTEHEDTPLTVAVSLNQDPVAEALLDGTANPNAKARAGITALHALGIRRMDTEHKETQEDFDARNIALLRRLFKSKADLDACMQDSSKGQLTPLQIALENFFNGKFIAERLAEEFLTLGAYSGLIPGQETQATPLQLVAGGRIINQMHQAFRESGRSGNRTDFVMQRSRQESQKYEEQDLRMTELLIQFGADVNEIALSSKIPPLMIAHGLQRTGIVSRLERAGAYFDPSALRGNGNVGRGMGDG